MNRKNFLFNTFVTSAGFMLIPNSVFSKLLLNFDDSGFVPLEAYKKDYQDLLNVNAYSASAATNKMLYSNGFSEGTKNDIYVKAIKDTLSNLNLPQLAPATAYKQKASASWENNVNMPHHNKGIIFKDYTKRESGYFLGPKLITKNYKSELFHSGVDIFYTHSAFLMYTQLEEYFCYGRPSSNPIINSCKYCNQEFIHQNFYYEGDSVYDRKEQEFWSNAFCAYHPGTNSFGQRIHAGIPTNLKFEDIIPCKLKVDSPCNKNYVIKQRR